MKKTALFIASFVLLCSYSLKSFGQSDAAVMRVAQNDLQTMLTQIPPGQLENFGFHDRSEFATATVGKPYRMLTFSTDFYKGAAIANNTAIVTEGQWRVPVLVNGQQRMLLTVAQNNGAYETIDMGAAGLAAELQQKGKNAAAGSELCLLRIYPLAGDILVEKTGASYDDAKFIPLYSATMAMPVLSEMEAPALTASQVMPVIKDALKNTQKH